MSPVGYTKKGPSHPQGSSRIFRQRLTCLQRANLSLATSENLRAPAGWDLRLMEFKPLTTPRDTALGSHQPIRELAGANQIK